MAFEGLGRHVYALAVKIIGQDGRSRSSHARHCHLRLLDALLKDWLELLLLPIILGAVLLILRRLLSVLSLHVVVVIFRLFLLLLLLLMVLLE